MQAAPNAHSWPGLDVPVHEAERVGFGQRKGHLLDEGDGAARFEGAKARDDPVEQPALCPRMSLAPWSAAMHEPAPVYPGKDLLDPSSRTLIVVGDTQETSWREVVLEQDRHLRILLLAEITRRRPTAVLHLGDLVTWGSSRHHWERLDAELAGLRARGTPLLPVEWTRGRSTTANEAQVSPSARSASIDFHCLTAR